MFILTDTDTAGSELMGKLRDVEQQNDPERFRENTRRLGHIIAYELSKSLMYKDKTVQTPLAKAKTRVPASQPVLGVVLRAGLPFYNGFLDMFPMAESAFVGAYRSAHKDGNSFDIAMEYIAGPDLTDKDLILIDPMLATGRSLVRTYEAMLRYGQPRSIHVACVIASQAGVDLVEKNIPKVQIWAGAVDAELNDHYYIVPGLGDAGDLSFGKKI